MASIHSSNRVRRIDVSSPEMSVDGVAIPEVVHPESAAEVAEILNDSRINSKGTIPTGGGTKLSIGNPLSRADRAVSLKHLNRVLAFEPDDLTLSVEAGITIGDLCDIAGNRGQTIPVEVPQPAKETIGGLIATALTGPRRYGSGTLRDALIGITVAYPDGTVGKAGGMVVKNVSGFDMMRMHYGAHGTLGIVVAANFKVVPVARSEATLVKDIDSVDDADTAMQIVASGRARPISMELYREGNVWKLGVRIEGRAETVRLLASELSRALQPVESLLFGNESEQYWRTYVSKARLNQVKDQIVIQIRVRPGDTLARLQSVIDVVDSARLTDSRVTASLGTGTIEVRWSARDNLATPSSEVVATLRARGTRTLVFAAPPAVKQGLDVWGFDPAEMQLMRRLKRQFDPWSVLNPGRLLPDC